MQVYVFDTNDLAEPLKRDDNVYSLPIVNVRHREG